VIIWLAETKIKCGRKQFSRCFSIAGFSRSDLRGKETKENIRKLKMPHNQTTFENVGAEDFLNINRNFKTEAAI
jgi:hypothetical protein